jgi:aspartate-semialdehyde dehydrogenase
VRRAHSAAVWVELERPLAPAAARALLERAPGLRVEDDPAAGRYPTPAEAEGRDEVLVGRIRADEGVAGGRGLALFVCGDQLRKGAALNAVQVAERALGVGPGA